MSEPVTSTFCDPVLHCDTWWGVRWLRLNRGEQHNPLDSRMLRSLLDQLRHPVDAPLVLCGEGASLSIGSDLRELATFSAQDAARYSLLAQDVAAALEAWPRPTICLLSGHVVGLGLEIALGCDLLAASADALVSLPGLPWALLPAAGGLRRLAARVPPPIAQALFLRGMRLNRDGALACGLVHQPCDTAAELHALLDRASDYSAPATAALRSLRLSRLAKADPTQEAHTFAHGFASGEVQRRLRALDL